MRQTCGFSAADGSRRWPPVPAASPLPPPLVHHQGAARPERRTDEAASAPVARAGRPGPSGSRGDSPRGLEGVQEDQGAPAPRATGGSRGCFDRATLPACLGCDGTTAAPPSGPVAQGSVARAAHAVRAPCDAAMWQPGLEQPPHALLGRHRTRCALCRGRCRGLQGALAVCQRAQAVLPDGHPAKVRGQRAQSLLATAARRSVVPVRVRAQVAGPGMASPPRASRPPMPRGATARAWKASAEVRQRRFYRVCGWLRASPLRASGRVKGTRTCVTGSSTCCWRASHCSAGSWWHVGPWRC